MDDLIDPRQLRQSMELFYFAYRGFTAQADRLLARRGLGRLHHRILYFVGRKPGLSVNELLATLAVSKQSLNAPLRQLLEMRLALASTPDHDRRKRQLCLSPEGERLVAQLMAAQASHLRAAFAPLDRQAVDGWLKVLAELSRLEQAQPGPRVARKAPAQRAQAARSARTRPH
jgi:DNA-binding MarR family transcriptional regulator